jgi:hypothetical protein
MSGTSAPNQTVIGNVQSGNRIVAEFGGTVIGLIQSVRFSDNYGQEDASGVGDIHVIEHVPSKAVHTVSVSRMVLRIDRMRSAGLIPENGDAVLQGKVFDIVLYSRDTGLALRKAISCSYDSGDIDVSAHRIVMESAQFKALDASGTGV